MYIYMYAIGISRRQINYSPIIYVQKTDLPNFPIIMVCGYKWVSICMTYNVMWQHSSLSNLFPLPPPPPISHPTCLSLRRRNVSITLWHWETRREESGWKELQLPWTLFYDHHFVTKGSAYSSLMMSHIIYSYCQLLCPLRAGRR